MKPNDEQLVELRRICDVCKRQHKCKDNTKFCLAKKLAWNYARVVYKRRVKKGLVNEDS